MNKTTDEPLPLFRNPWFKIGVAVTLLLVAIFCLTDLPGAATLRRIIGETLEAASAETQREREKPAAGWVRKVRRDAAPEPAAPGRGHRK